MECTTVNRTVTTLLDHSHVAAALGITCHLMGIIAQVSVYIIKSCYS